MSNDRLPVPSKIEGKRVLLIPLELSHAEELWETAKDETIWTHYTFRQMKTYERFLDFINDSVRFMTEGKEFTFTVIDKSTGKMMGGTSFLDIQTATRSLEIGRTWISPLLQGTGFNTECKYVLLKCCFEELKLIRVFFKTDSNNKRSQKALEKIGAKYEGILRNHMIREDGTFRHSVYYSVIENEWPQTGKHLENLLVKL